MRPVRHLPVAHGVPLSWVTETSMQASANFGAPAIPEPEDIQDSGEDDEKLLQVGDIAKASGKTVRAIHHYEEVGILRPHTRSKGRYRLYDQAALNRVRWIGKLHDLGLSLSQIQEMVATWETATSAPGAMARIRAIYTLKLE